MRAQTGRIIWVPGEIDRPRGFELDSLRKWTVRESSNWTICQIERSMRAQNGWKMLIQTERPAKVDGQRGFDLDHLRKWTVQNRKNERS